MIRYEYDDEEEPLQEAGTSEDNNLDDIDMEEFGDIGDFLADPNFQAIVNETPWLQSIANEFYSNPDLNLFDDEPLHDPTLPTQDSSSTADTPSSQLFPCQAHEPQIKIEPTPIDEFNNEDLFMDENLNLHNQQLMEYHQAVKKFEEDFDQPQHSRAHMSSDQGFSNHATALKPKNEENRPSAPLPPGALQGRAPLLSYGTHTNSNNNNKPQQGQQQIPVSQPKVVEERKYEGFGKPSYSYSCLIGLALKNSATGQLTVSEIYAFMCEHFPYFRGAPSGWKNSVRHNLSLNKCFQKIEVDEPGCHGRKSCLWRLNPAKQMKMDQEIRKWRERNEKNILSCMSCPDDLDLIEAGKKGMPASVRKRQAMEKPVVNMNWPRTITQPKIIRRPTFLTKGNTNFKILAKNGETVRQAAARNLEQLLHQRSAPIIPNYRQNTSHKVQMTNSEGKTTVIRVTSAGRHTQTFNTQITSNSTSIPSDLSTTSVSTLPVTSTTATIRIGGITVRTVDPEAMEQTVHQNQASTSSFGVQMATSTGTTIHQQTGLQTTFPILNQRAKSPSRDVNFASLNRGQIKVEIKEESGMKNDLPSNLFSPPSNPFYYDLLQEDNRALLEAPIDQTFNERSLSPFHFLSGGAYETVNQALNDNSLLKSALAQSPCKSNQGK